MKTYRIIRTHTETYVLDGIKAESKEDAVEIAKSAFEANEYEHVESSAYEYEAVEEKWLS